MITKTITLYQFNELSDTAKEKARDWWKECESQDFGSFGDVPDEVVETAAKLLGIEFKTRPVKLMGGKTRYESCIWWQLDGQGSGASFEATYSYVKGSAKAIAKEFPTNVELNRIARELTDLQKQYAYGITATIETSGREVHKYAMTVDVNGRNGSALPENDADAFRELMRDFADWIWAGINDEYNYRMSDRNVDETIMADEYTFTEDGSRES